MNETELQKLALLSRISVSPDELKKLHEDMEAVLKYISQIQEVASQPQIGTGHPINKTEEALINVTREDENPHESALYAKELLAEAPRTKNDYVQVKKIL
ncbi:MAG: aspartyl/glutamyl-tRNA amidotransferase subunit C [Parcubacteria group bacterium]|nr:aspartyl/glutamyl-tRNA amidotransferase subunit C [Parcubacteria group bacterium]